MNNWRYRLARMMQGRYGPDDLYRGLFALFLVLAVLNLFVRSSLLSLLPLAIMGWSMYRVFSRNLQKRAAENQRYLALVGPYQKRALRLFNRVREYRTHRYRNCPQCKTPLRLKKQLGVVHVKCPRCQTEFDVTIRR